MLCSARCAQQLHGHYRCQRRTITCNLVVRIGPGCRPLRVMVAAVPAAARAPLAGSSSPLEVHWTARPYE